MINIYDEIISHPDYFKQISVNDVLFVHYKCPQKEKMVRLLTHYNNFIYSLTGARKLVRNSKSWLLAEDTCLFMKKSAYEQEWYEQKDWTVLAFFIPDDYLRKVLNEFRSLIPTKSFSSPSKECIINLEVNETTKAFFYSIIPYFTQNPPPSINLLEMKFRELILNVLCNPVNSELVGYINDLGRYDKPLLTEIMESNYMYNLSLEEFARLSSRSVATFKRDFLKTYQITPGKWLLQKRVKHADRLLKTTNAAIQEIAIESGFETSSHFSRVFKQILGYSPIRSRTNEWVTESGSITGDTQDL